MSLLFSPYTTKTVTLKNRIVVSPMCQYSAVDGLANHWHLVHLGSRAVGGAGLLMQEATAVSSEGRISLGDLGLWNDAQIVPLQSITEFIKGQGAVPGIQLAHAGRKAGYEAPWKGGKWIADSTVGLSSIAPSAIPFVKNINVPAEMSIEDIERVVTAFAAAAKRAVQAGYQVLEIHAAHGYLIHQFLSPLSNQRTDDYGGSFDNRIRFLRKVIKAVQTTWPSNLPLWVRISATDWIEGGWTIEEAVHLSVALKNWGVDLVDCSTGGNIAGVTIPVAPGYQVPFAATIKQQAGIATGAVGLITSAQQAEAILQAQQADLILLGRELLRDPYFPLHAAKELNEAIGWPSQYERAK